jgi:hypothetical protein
MRLVPSPSPRFICYTLPWCVPSRSHCTRRLPLLTTRVYSYCVVPQADQPEVEEERGPFRRYFYRGIEVSALLDLSQDQLLPLFHARARRRFALGLSAAHVGLVKRLRKAKKNPGPDGKPGIVMVPHVLIRGYERFCGVARSAVYVCVGRLVCHRGDLFFCATVKFCFVTGEKRKKSCSRPLIPANM